MCECNGHSDACHPETGACSVSKQPVALPLRLGRGPSLRG